MAPKNTDNKYNIQSVKSLTDSVILIICKVQSIPSNEKEKLSKWTKKRVAAFIALREENTTKFVLAPRCSYEKEYLLLFFQTSYQCWCFNGPATYLEVARTQWANSLVGVWTKNVGEVFATEIHSRVSWRALSKCVGRVKDAKDGFIADWRDRDTKHRWKTHVWGGILQNTTP